MGPSEASFRRALSFSLTISPSSGSVLNVRAFSSEETAAGRAAISHCTKRLESIERRSLEVSIVTGWPVASLVPVGPNNRRPIKTARRENGLTLEVVSRLWSGRARGMSRR